MDFNPVTDDIGLMIPPPANNEGSALNVLELAPGLAVKIRYINNNWHLVPTTAPVDVEGLIVDRLVAKLRHPAEISYDEICCLLNAVANRRDSLINAWRNTQGLLGTDKPLPLSEISPLAMVEDEDQALNLMPTTESTGEDKFDFIEYTLGDPYKSGVWELSPYFGQIRIGMDWKTFKQNDRVRFWVEEIATGKRVSPIHDLNLKMTEYSAPTLRGSPPQVIYEWRCWPLETYCLVIPYGSNSFDMITDGGPKGCGTAWEDRQRTSEGGCGHLPEHIFKDWPGDDSLGLELSLHYVDAGSGWNPVPNNVYRVIVEKSIGSEYGIGLLLDYYNHGINQQTQEVKQYSKPYRDKSLLKLVHREEIKILDEMRVNGLINGPQWTSAKQQLESLSQLDVTWPSDLITPIIEPLPPWPPIVPIPPPVIPPIPELPEIPPIILPPIEIPPVPPPIFPRKLCEKDILGGRWL